MLEGDTWVYSLDLQSNAFREQMGDFWTGVTWKIQLARMDHHYDADLWRIEDEWKPDFIRWHLEQYSICLQISTIPAAWTVAHSPILHYSHGEELETRLARSKPNLLEGGDGTTYNGPQ
ncbi:uncharacterized protein LY89DRAFT_238763 [Mollisia scopiformis]|uniref:Uncharacterized protein n=1 Tax=Mollisia scopiformis TaxID=149040 RepID=A0A194WT79_MOLSC|nr:uncharacterized protein LY89DRAFT_238763 [Mollisia scopiformis]KUJ11160.1 hypothetical protein LY89DRAFT_238763 [Mollisia scopiformis]